MKKTEPAVALTELVIFIVFLYFCLRLVLDYPVFICGLLIGCYKDKIKEFVKSVLDSIFCDEEK